MSLVSLEVSGIGTYKGVMLCNRPIGGVDAPGRRVDTKFSFSCGTVPDPIGIGSSQVPAIFSKTEQINSRTKKISIIHKHKKWLDELQKDKFDSELKFKEEEALKNESKEKFMEAAAKQRQIELQYYRDANTATTVPAESKTEHAESKEPEAKCHKSSSSTTADQSKKSKFKFLKATIKPKWSMTEQEAKESSEDLCEAEEDTLLNFVEELDFKRFVNDLKVQNMIEKLKERIQELESDVDKDLRREEEAKVRSLQRQQFIATGHMANDANYEIALDDSTDAKSVFTDEGDRDLLNCAERLCVKQRIANKNLAEDKLTSIKDIHSKRSIAALLRSLKDSPSNEEMKEEPAVLHEPLIVSHAGEAPEGIEGRRGRIMFEAARLPYLHRNPAV